MKVVFSTNLDEPKHDVCDLNHAWKASHVPRTGELIAFEFGQHPAKRYELEVVAVRHVCHVDGSSGVRVHVELHIPSYMRQMSIRDWSEWFRKHRRGADY